MRVDAFVFGAKAVGIKYCFLGVGGGAVGLIFSCIFFGHELRDLFQFEFKLFSVFLDVYLFIFM